MDEGVLLYFTLLSLIPSPQVPFKYTSKGYKIYRHAFKTDI